jgi:hypothetical protein
MDDDVINGGGVQRVMTINDDGKGVQNTLKFDDVSPRIPLHYTTDDIALETSYYFSSCFLLTV